MTVDPVCKMALEESRTEHRCEYNGKTYYFCGHGCEERFRKDPEKYLKGDKVDWIKGQ